MVAFTPGPSPTSVSNFRLSRNDHVDCVRSRLQQRLYFLRRLRVFGVSQKIMFLFYQAVLESIIRYRMSAWFGNHSAQSKAKLQRLVQTAVRVMGRTEKLSLQATSSLYSDKHRGFCRTCHTSFTLSTSSSLLAEGTESQNVN